MKAKLSFQITSSRDFLNKLLQEYEDFDKQHLNPRYAINCAITSWHLTDWSYHEFYSEHPEYQDEIRTKKNNREFQLSGLKKYQNWLIKKCEELKYMQFIANGSKHCVLNDNSLKLQTTTSEGHYSTKYSRHDFEVPRFVIKINQNNFIDFEQTFLATKDFWIEFLKQTERDT
jgi:hypothetical protein